MTFNFPPLYVVCDAAVCERAGWELADFAFACLDGGARFLQIRAKQLAGNAFLAAATAIAERAAQAAGAVIVNDRADIAQLSGAAGVHVGQEDLSAAQVRSIVGDKAIVGLSTHTPNQIEAALTQPISYLAIGPVFPTGTKETDYQAVGLDAVRKASALAAPRLPVVAIGGITLDRARSVVEAGADSVAVISDLLAAGDPAARVREYLARLDAP